MKLGAQVQLGTGALVWAGFDGEHAPGPLLDAIRTGGVGGVLLFAFRGNIRSKAQVRAMLREVQDAARRGGLPPVPVAVDQEGGTVIRIGYRATFPSLFRDANQMPADLRAHIRYPETLLRAQGDVYGLYHVQNGRVFFQQEDAWSIAQQMTVDQQNKKQNHPIDPYFVLMQLPGEDKQAEFALILPFTPANRNNMIGWMAGRSDGENYGKLLAYNFPKSRLIDGPLQIEARIDQDAQLSAQFSLWNQQGSRVLRGHLLVIPIGKSLLYVEPIYLQAVNSPMPELRLVVLATQERLAFGQSFDEAMSNLFGDAGKQTAEQKPAEQKPTTGDQAKPTPTPPAPTTTGTTQQLITRAVQEFEDYQKLMAAGRYAEAGKKLEEHKRTLEELKRAAGKP